MYLNWLQLTCTQEWIYSNWGLNLTYSQKSRSLNMYKSYLRRWHYVPRSIPGPSDWQPLPHQLQDVLSVCSHWGGTWQSIHPQYSSGYDQSHGEEETVVVLTMLGKECILSRNVLQGKWITCARYVSGCVTVAASCQALTLVGRWFIARS